MESIDEIDNRFEELFSSGIYSQKEIRAQLEGNYFAYLKYYNRSSIHKNAKLSILIGPFKDTDDLKCHVYKNYLLHHSLEVSEYYILSKQNNISLNKASDVLYNLISSFIVKQNLNDILDNKEYSVAGGIYND